MRRLPNRLQSIALAISTSLLVLVSGASGFITPVNARATTYYGSGINVFNLIDGSGLSDPNGTSDSILDNTHDNHSNALTMWHAGCTEGPISGGLHPNCVNNADTIPRVADQRVEFLLGDDYNVNGAVIWQLNQLPGRGADEVNIWVSESVQFDDYVMVSSIRMDPADGSGPVLPQSFSFGEVRARRVMLEFQSAQSGQEFEYVGLSEVRFEGTLVPEPMATSLIGLGLLGLLFIRRKK